MISPQAGVTGRPARTDRAERTGHGAIRAPQVVGGRQENFDISETICLFVINETPF